MGRRFAPFKRFCAAKTLALGGFISPKAYEITGPPRSLLRGAEQKQLDELNIACTKKEEEE